MFPTERERAHARLKVQGDTKASRWGGEDGLRAQVEGVLQYEEGWLIIQDWKADGTSQKEPTFAIELAVKLVGLHISLQVTLAASYLGS